MQALPTHEESRTAFAVVAALARRQADAFADELAGGTAEFFSVAGAVAAGIVTTGSTGRAAVGTAGGRCLWTGAGDAVPGLGSGTADRFGRRSWTACRIGGSCPIETGKRGNGGRGAFEKRAPACIASQSLRDVIETIAVHAEVLQYESKRRRGSRLKRSQIGLRLVPLPRIIPGISNDITGAPFHAECFVSYASVDRSRTMQIVEAVRAQGLEVWIDQAGIAGGTSYGTEIANALRDAEAVLLIASDASLASKNVRQEIMLAWRYDKPIIPLDSASPDFPGRCRVLAGRRAMDRGARPGAIGVDAEAAYRHSPAMAWT